MFANRRTDFVKDSPTHFALRQWRAQFTNPATLLILGAMAALLSIVGPFDTSLYLTLAPRFGYWLVMAAVTYSLGLLINTALSRALPPALPMPLCVAIAAAVTGLAITPVVVAINFVTFRTLPGTDEWPMLLLKFFAIAVIISVIFQAISALHPEPDATPEQPPHPALLDRLPLDKRGPLVAMSSEDHYTRIRTTKGEGLVLIRLSDAIREAEPTPGLRVHRSHWVALSQVAQVTRDGDRAVLTMRQGGDIPVSRANIAAIRDAGLLPQ